MPDMIEQLRRLRVIPVITIESAEDAIPLGRALSEGGLPCAEVTFRTAGAGEAIRRMTGELPDMLVGAGTVLTVEQAAEARAAGAKFIVSPGFSPKVVDYCLENGIAVYPGVCTPTEIEAALDKGLRVLKFFPAEFVGGTAFLKAVGAPYGMVQFIPTGGVNTANIAAYLALKNVVACGGSWMAPADWIRAKDFDRIRGETRKAVQSVQG